MPDKDFDLRGKDYLSQAEAGHYCCLSPNAFRDWSRVKGIQCGRIGGKLLYRRSDLTRAIENNWRPSLKPVKGGISTGTRKTAHAGANH